MRDTYASVAATYDLMIDWPARLARERPFFSALMRGGTVGQRVLDVGCGTGHHGGMFAELGATVIGIDPSTAMLARAGDLFPGGNPRFIAGAFADVPSLPGQFDLITVLGNTLAYARDEQELLNILRAMREKLAPSGQLCVQVVNYDSLPVEESRWLPLIHRRAEGQDYLFLREYRRKGERVEFTIITLNDAENWRQQVERSLHLPISEDLLRDALRRAGFTTVACYGDYQRAFYRPATSAALIALAG